MTVKKVLVVDDGAVERLAGQSMLEKLGFAVTATSSGEDALHCMQQAAFDVVLCDISMPGMGGLELLERSQAHANPPLFIMSTSHDDAEHARASLRLGAYGYLTKPLRFEQLRATLDEVFARQTKERHAAQLAAGTAQPDALTGLANRNAFTEQLAGRLQHAAADSGRGALLLIKLIGLNHINHSYSRAEGNRLLQTAAATLQQLVRPSDLLARFAGDLFAVYLDGIAESDVVDRAISIAERVESVKMTLAGDAFALNLVIGGAFADSRMDTEDLLNRADFALHLAREQSRSKIHIYSEADEAHKRELSQQFASLALVRAALDDTRRLVMHYQPIVDLGNGRVSHYEALLRLCDENGKPCNTGELVKTCEVFGLIGRLDLAVVNACFNDVRHLPDGTCMAINLSGKSIGDPALLHFIETRITELAIDPRCIIFELTETAAFYNLDEVRHFVKRIKDLGCRFALDDFGVGFSSFYYIKELDFDYLKIDGSFIKNLPNNANDQVFVRAMVEISRVFGMAVIAEWVEDAATADLLRGFNVAYGQGWHFGKPAPLAKPA